VQIITAIRQRVSRLPRHVVTAICTLSRRLRANAPLYLSNRLKRLNIVIRDRAKDCRLARGYTIACDNSHLGNGQPQIALRASLKILTTYPSIGQSFAFTNRFKLAHFHAVTLGCKPPPIPL
jgi:hypothetical protein